MAKYNSIKPYNPLDNFESYSTHFVLLACRSTVGAAGFVASTPETLAAIDNTKKLGDPIVLGTSKTDAYLVLDTRRFGQFTVDELRYEVRVDGLRAGVSTSNLSTDLTMTVIDSAGISFLNFLQWLTDSQMKTNYDGLVFLLKTIFVGHNADGTSEVVQTETIPMHLFSAEVNLSVTSGVYNLGFMPNMNFDPRRFSRFLTISTANTYTTGSGNTLGGLIDSIEKSLNDNSSSYFKEVQDEVKKVLGANAKQFGRKVQYMITIPEHWKAYTLAGSNVGDTLETRFTSLNKDTKKQSDTASATPGAIKTSNASAGRGATIVAALDAIFEQVPQIVEMGTFTKQPGKDGFITFYKHVIGLSSDDSTLLVHVDVIEYKIPNIVAQNMLSKSKNPTIDADDKEFFRTIDVKDSLGKSTGVVRKVPKEFLEWDYIYSGRNDSILNFDMKIQEFQMMLAQNLNAGDAALRYGADSSKTPDDGDSSSGSGEDLLAVRQYDPILLPLDSRKAMSNFKSRNTLMLSDELSKNAIKQQQQYTQNLSLYYAASPITTVMTIRGNPLIMHKFNVGELLGHPGAAVSPNTPSSQVSAAPQNKTEYRKQFEKNILERDPGTTAQNGSFTLSEASISNASYIARPVWAKVNVYGPSVDFKTNDDITGAEFPQSVISDNFYSIFTVRNIISRGVFTQELELMTNCIFGRTKSVKDDTK